MQNLTQQIEVDIDVQTTKKPSKMFSAGPFGQLKNHDKCFRQIRSDSSKTFKNVFGRSVRTAEKPAENHDFRTTQLGVIAKAELGIRANAELLES